VLFQLQLLSEIQCTVWQVCTFTPHDRLLHSMFIAITPHSQTKLDSITTAIVTNIAENCGCPLFTEDVFGDAIICDTGSMVYRAGIGATSQFSIDDITNTLNNWIEQSSVFIVHGDMVEIDSDPSCPLLISSLNEPACGDSDGTSGSSTPASLLAGIIIGMCAVLAVIVTLIVIVVFKCRRKTDKIRYGLFCDMAICAMYLGVCAQENWLLIFFHRPGGNSPVSTAVAMTQMRSTRRKSQTNEENTYSEVFSITPSCPVQSCPAYQSSIDLTQSSVDLIHDYDFVNDPSNIANRHFSSPAKVQLYSRRPSSPGHTGPLHLARPDSNHAHAELELSFSSITSGPGQIDNCSTYSEPIALAPRLYSKASQIDFIKRAESTSTACNEYLEPVSKNSSKASLVDYKRSRSDSTTSHNLHIVRKNQQELQFPSDYTEPVSSREQTRSADELTTHGYIEPVSIREQTRSADELTTHGYIEPVSIREQTRSANELTVPRTQYTSSVHDYSEIPSARNSFSNDYVDNPVRLKPSDWKSISNDYVDNPIRLNSN